MQDVVNRGGRRSPGSGNSTDAPGITPYPEINQLPYTTRGRSAIGAAAATHAGLPGLWRESLQILSAHSAPILILACFGLTGATLLGAVITTLLLPGAFGRNGRFAFPANIPGAINPQLIVQAVVGTFAYILARGAITWIALHASDERRPTVRDALRAALKRWPELLAQSLVYGIIITLGVAWLTLLLRDLHLDITNIGRVTPGLGDMSRAAAIRSLGVFVPDPGSPFSELFTYVRNTLNRTAYYSWYADREVLPMAEVEMWLIGLGGVVLIVLTETLLRLRTVFVMRESAGSVSYAGLVDSVRAGVHNFGYITLNTWLLRIAMVVIAVVFTVVPTTFAQSIIVPFVARLTSTFWPYPLSSALFALGAALVGMVPAAFAMVFDTRILATLPRPAREHLAL